MVMITEITGIQSVSGFLRGLGSETPKLVKSEVSKLGYALQALVKTKLSDDVLHVRTGTLRRSIYCKVTHEGGIITATVGTNVVYACIHEFGGDIKIGARTSTTFRKLSKGTVGGKFISKKSAMKRAAKGGSIAFDHKVGAYTIHMPQRSFLGSSLLEMRPEILARLDAVVNRGIGSHK